jgi:phosphoribosylformylglycinamidine synthase
MTPTRCIILRAAGINCDLETEHAWSTVGVRADRIHVNRLIENPALLSEYQILTIPGGFSYGDDVAAGKILANQLLHHLGDALRSFIDKGNLVLGICNGFQVLIKTGLLPGSTSTDGSAPGATGVSIAANDSDKFEDRWVHLKPASSRCVFLKRDELLYLPIAHGEGKLVVSDEAQARRLDDAGHVALRYVDASGRPGPYPINPNGSILDAAGLTDETGRVFGLMPHPERNIHRTNHPLWTRLPADHAPDGRRIFQNAADYFAV